MTLDMRHYLIVMKETDPDRSLRSLSEEMQRRFGIKVGRTSISRTLKNSDQIKSLMSQMMSSGVGPKGRKRYALFKFLFLSFIKIRFILELLFSSILIFVGFFNHILLFQDDVNISNQFRKHAS